jgi:phosphoglycerol transferase MdoB-like AlkP superfamily enzyme
MPSALRLRTSRARDTLRHSRFILAALLVGAYGFISLTTRIVLGIKAHAAGLLAAVEIPRILAVGMGYDAIVAISIAAALVVWLVLLPERWYHQRWHRALIWTGFTLTLFGLMYLGAAEYFFFDEFDSRFNFIAVEYLIYPHEVFVNIWQSYPVAKVMIASGVATALVLWLARGILRKGLDAKQRFSQRLPWGIAVCGTLLAAHLAFNINSGRNNVNRVADELAANGLYTFVNAAVNNHLDYNQFYTTLNHDQAIERARRIVAQPNAAFIPGAAHPLARHVSYPQPPQLLNVIVLLEESLGAEFVGEYSQRPGLTPNLDRIGNESLVFKRTYASGTRTVRGMESVTASFPPVPPESIVKRSKNEGMFNWSTVMKENGYTPTFIYGGYGTFDNMNYFFGHNGYKVIDRTDMPKANFANIWGVSDEDLFRNAFHVFDEQHRKGERIFSVVMTTSNHKPFTFPAGVPGVKPEGGGRESGVRYADYAIGWFIEELKKKPYFDNTLVVIVADHGARAYGRASIPLPTYEIPFMVYSPKHIQPRRFDGLTSQLDVAPTVLGLLNISYDSLFFGKDTLIGDAQSRVAVLNHNRDIALLHNEQLAQLGFRKTRSMASYDKDTRMMARLPNDEEALRDAAAMFQIAYDSYANRRPVLASVPPR